VGGSCTAATFTATTTPMGSARANHTATLVADGTVLIAGGEVDATGTPTNTAEIYCSAVANPPCAAADAGTYKSVMSVMSVARSSHTATTLQDNRVLIAGGETSGMPTPTASADVYCAVAAANCASNLGTFQRVGSLVVGRTLHTSTLLTDGSALVVGGLGATNTQLNSSELFDPGANNFTTDALMSIGRAGATATLLLDGRVLVTGGQTTTGTTTQATKTAEVYQNLP